MKHYHSQFRDTVFFQLLSNTASKCFHFHISHNKIFKESIHNNTPSLMAPIETLPHFTHSSKKNTESSIFLPILKKLKTISPQKRSRPTHWFSTLKKTIRSWVKKHKSHPNTPFNSPFFTQLQLNPEKKYPQLKRHSLYSHSKQEIAAIESQLHGLINLYTPSSTWFTEGLYHQLKQLYRNTNKTQHQPTVSNLEALLAQTPKLNYHFRKSCQEIQKQLLNHSLTSTELHDWQSYIQNFMTLNEALLQLFLNTKQYRLHALIISHHSLKESESSPFKTLIEDTLAKTVSTLHYQEGPLADMLHCIQTSCDVFSELSKADHDLITTDKVSFFKLKRRLIEHKEQCQLKIQKNWFHTINCYFQDNSQSVTEAGEYFISEFFNQIPSLELFPIAAKELQQMSQKLEAIILTLPADVQNQSNLSIRVPKQTLLELNQCCHHYFHLLYWMSLISLSSAKYGRYSLIPECLIALQQNIDSSQSTIDLLQYSAVLFNPQIFEAHCDYLVELYPQQFLQLCEQAIYLYTIPSQSELISDSTDTEWWNSLYFKNKWISHCRVALFNLPKKYWDQLFPHINETQILSSPLIKEWVRFYPTHHLEKQCLHYLIAFFTTNKTQPDSKKQTLLYNLYITLKKQDITLSDLEKVAIQHKLHQDNIRQHCDIISELLHSHQQKAQFAISLSIQTLIKEFNAIECLQSSAICLDIMESEHKQLLFILAICLQQQLSCSTQYLEWFSYNIGLSNVLQNQFSQWISESFSHWELDTALASFLNSLSKTASPHCRHVVTQLLASQDNQFSSPSQERDPFPEFPSVLLNTYKAQLLSCCTLSLIPTHYAKQASSPHAKENPSLTLHSTETLYATKKLLEQSEKKHLSLFDINTAKHCSQLLNYACTPNKEGFDSTYVQLLTLLNQPFTLTTTQQCLLGYWMALSSFLFQDSDSPCFYFPTQLFQHIHLTDFDQKSREELQTDTKLFREHNLQTLIFLLHCHREYFHQCKDYTVTKTDFAQLQTIIHEFQKISAQYPEHSTKFIADFLSLFKTLFLATSSTNSQALQTALHCLNSTYNALEILKEHNPLLFNATLDENIHILIQLLESGLYIPDHSLSAKLQQTLETKKSPTIYHHQLMDLITNYNDIQTLYNKLKNFKEIEKALTFDFFKKNARFMTIYKPGLVLTQAQKLLQELTTLQQEILSKKMTEGPQTDKIFQAYTSILNCFFNQSLTTKEWINNTLFIQLLESFYNPSSHTTNEIIQLSAQDYEHQFITSLFENIPSQILHILTHSMAQKQKTSPSQQQRHANFIHNINQRLLDSPNKALTTVGNGGLKGLIQLKQNLEENHTIALTHCHAFIQNSKQSLHNSKHYIQFIQQLHRYLESLSNKNNLQPIPLDDSQIVNQIFSICKEFSMLSTEYKESNTDLQLLKQCISSLYLPLFLYLQRHHKSQNMNTSLISEMLTVHSSEIKEALTQSFAGQSQIQYKQCATLLDILSTNASLCYDHLLASPLLNKCSTDISDVVIKLYATLSIQEINNLLLNESSYNELFRKLCNQSPALFSILLSKLKETAPKQYYSIYDYCISTEHPLYNFLSCLDSIPKDQESLGKLIKTIGHENKDIIKENALFIETQAHKNPSQFRTLIDYLFLHSPTQFKRYCLINNHQLCETLLDSLFISESRENHSHPELLRQWINHPIVHCYLEEWLSKKQTKDSPQNLSPAFSHCLIYNHDFPLNSFSTEQLINWLLYTEKNNYLSQSYTTLQANLTIAVDCFVPLFFIKTSPSHLHSSTTLILDFLVELDSKQFQEFLSICQENYTLSKHFICNFIFKALLETKTPQAYYSLFNTLSPHSPTISSQSSPNQVLTVTQLNAHSTLCQNHELSLSDILELIQTCRFVPHTLLHTHLETLSNALLSDLDNDLLDFALQNPPLFQQLLLTKQFSSSVQQGIYYKKITETHSLFPSLKRAIQSFSYIETLCFLSHYVSSQLTPSKQEQVQELLEYYYSPSTPLTPSEINTVKTHFFTLINTPILRIPVKDPFILEAFTQFQSEEKEEIISDQLFSYIHQNPLDTSSNSFEYLWIKKQFEQLCQTPSQRQLFFILLQQPSIDLRVELCYKYTQFWEEKNSLFDILQLSILDAHENQQLYSYLDSIARIITKQPLPPNNTQKAKILVQLAGFFIAQDIHKSALLDYCKQQLKTADNTIQELFISLLASHALKKKDALAISSTLIHQQKNNAYVFQHLYKQPFFIELWNEFLIINKHHVILSELLIPSSTLFPIIRSALIYFAENQPQYLFNFCELNYQNQLFIDPLFVQLINHFFPESKTITVSYTPNNPFIHCCKLALKHTEKGFLFFLGRCIENYLIPNRIDISWFLKQFSHLYRLPIQTVATDENETMSSHLTKQLIRSKIINDHGELLEDLSQQSLDSIKQNFTQEHIEDEYFFIQLKQFISKQWKKKEAALSLLLQTCPKFFLSKEPMLTHHESKTPTYLFKHCPSLLDLSLTMLFNSNQVPQLLNDLLFHCFKQTASKDLFIHYIKGLKTQELYHLVSHPNITASNRHILLQCILFEDHKKRSAIQGWEELVVKTLLTDLSDIWNDTENTASLLPHIEILLFFFLHFPDTFQTIIEPQYVTIFTCTGISFSHLFSCKHIIEKYGRENDSFTLANLHTLSTTLQQHGFNLFEQCYAFRASSYYSQDLEKEWLNWVQEKDNLPTIQTITSPSLALYASLPVQRRSLYIPEALFHESEKRQLFKKWLIENNCLNSMNLLSVTSYEEFSSLYDIRSSFLDLTGQNDMHGSLNISEKDFASIKAEQFFTDFFTQVAAIESKDPLYSTQYSLLLRLFPHLENTYQHKQFTDSLKILSEHLNTQNISQLLSTQFHTIYLALLLNDSQTDINPQHIESLINATSFHIDFSHTVFDPLSNKEKKQFIQYLNKKELLSPSLQISLSTFNAIKSSINHPHYQAFQQLEKYILSQRNLLNDCFTIQLRLYLCLSLSKANAKKQFSKLFTALHEHEWLFIKHLLRQEIDSKTLATHLNDFLTPENKRKSDTTADKNFLTTMAQKLSETQSESDTIASSFQEHNETLATVDTHIKLTKLMDSLSQSAEL